MKQNEPLIPMTQEIRERLKKFISQDEFQMSYQRNAGFAQRAE